MNWIEAMQQLKPDDKLYFIVDKNQDGDFHAHVENENVFSLFEYKLSNEKFDYLTEMLKAGFMYKTDTENKYLIDRIAVRNRI
jgi:hypothetical protein